MDLTTENAIQTKNYWENEITKLRQATNVKIIAQNIKQAPQVHHVKVLAYRNGRANKTEAVLISGSSIVEVDIYNKFIKKLIYIPGCRSHFNY